MVTQCLSDSCTVTSPGGPSVGHGMTASSPQPTQIDSVSSNTGCSTNVTSSSTGVTSQSGQASPQQNKRPGENRRSKKPIMEKKRRARINNCINELKSMILDAMKKDPARHSKLEKADILEMTVKHLETMQRQQSAITVATDPQVLNKFRAGFSECAGEVGRFPGLEPPVRRRLLQHLTNVLNTSTGNENPETTTLPTNPGGTASATTIPGLQVHILPAISVATNEGNTSATPLLTQQSVLFSTSGNGASLQLVPTRLPNGDIALVLPTSPANHQSAVNINPGSTNATSSTKDVNNVSGSQASRTVIVSGTVTPPALSPLPMLIPISSKNSSQLVGTVSSMFSPTSTSTVSSTNVSNSLSPSSSSISQISTIPSVQTPSSTSLITSTNSSVPNSNVTNTPSSSSMLINKQSFVLSTVSAAGTNSNVVTNVAFNNRQSPVSSTVSPPPNISTPSSTSFDSRQSASPSVVEVQRMSPNSQQLASENLTSKNSPSVQCSPGENSTSANVATRNFSNMISFVGENMNIPQRTLQNVDNVDGENLTLSRTTLSDANSVVGDPTSINIPPRTSANVANFARETSITTRISPRNLSPEHERLFTGELVVIPRDVPPRYHSHAVSFARERLIHIPTRTTTSPLPLVSVSSKASSLASPISPDLRRLQQNHESPIREEFSSVCSVSPGLRYLQQGHILLQTRDELSSSSGVSPGLGLLQQACRLQSTEEIPPVIPGLRQPQQSHRYELAEEILQVSPGLRHPQQSHRFERTEEISRASPELKNPHQTHRLPSRDEFYHDESSMNIDMREPVLQMAPSQILPNNFSNAQGIDLRIEQNRGHVSPPLTRPSLVMKNTEDEDDEMPWRPW